MPEPTSQSFENLLAAKTAAAILKALAICVAEADNRTDSHIPTLQPFAEHLNSGAPQTIADQSHNLPTIAEYAATHNISTSTVRRRIRSKQLNTHRRHGRVFIVDSQTSLPDSNTPAASLQPVHTEILQIAALLNQNQSPDASDFYTSALRLFFPVAQRRPYLPTIEHDIETIHRSWFSARKYDSKISHPLRHPMRKWQVKSNSQPLNDGKPLATLHRGSTGSIRHKPTTYDASINLFHHGLPTSYTQLELFSGVNALSQVPRIHVAQHIRGVDLTARQGQLPMEISLLFECFMALKPNQTHGTFSIRLTQLCQLMFPGVTRIQPSHITSIVNGLKNLVEIGIPYIDPESNSPGLWLPVMPQNLPTESSDPGFMILINTSTPPDAKGGFLVERTLIHTFRRWAGRVYGYLAFCEYSDRYRNIDPTIPTDPPKDNKGYYLDPKGNHYLTARGKPIKDLYHPELIPRLARKENPHAQYPPWTDEDLIRACKIEYKSRRQARDLAYSLEQFRQMAQLGILTIVTPGKNRHHIQPGNRHLNAVRALRKAIAAAAKHRHITGSKK